MTASDRTLVLSSRTRLGLVRLRVSAIDRALSIWRDMVGLHVLDADADFALLGIDGTPMIELSAGADGPAPRMSLGLYHIAIHVPARKELARAIARQIRAGVRTAPTDHLVSEATYLWDVDGNGIELTFETPARGSYQGNETDITFVTAEGRPHSGVEPIDLDDIMRELSPDDDLTAPLPAGTRLGHIHLHVGDLETSMRFWADTIGFQRQILSTRFGMGDVRTSYEPHIVAFNIWSGPNAAHPPASKAGLTDFEFVLENRADLDGIVDRLDAAEHAYDRVGETVGLADPSGNRFRLTVA